MQQNVGPKDLIYPTEIKRHSCSYNDQTGETYDSRFYDTGMSEDEYSVQSNNGVMDILKHLPEYKSAVPDYKDK